MVTLSIASFSFASPWWLLSLLMIPIVVYFKFYRGRPDFGTLNLPISPSVSSRLTSSRRVLPRFSEILIIAAWFCISIAMAGPRHIKKSTEHYTEGIDIVIVLDISLSMLARDFEPNRLEAAKDIIAKFVKERTTDRISLVVFAGQPFTLCPLTADKGAILNVMQQAQAGFIEDGSTAIGDGIAAAVNRLRESDAKSKVIVMLTDGENNAGNIEPLQAAEIASLFGIRLYNIGIGSQGTAIGPVQIIDGNIIFGPVPVEIDEKVLKTASDMTGGKYFRATGNKGLREIYKDIDAMEKSKLMANVRIAHKELHTWFAGTALVLISIAWLLRYIFAKILP